MALTLVITNAGRAALRNADASGTRAVRIAAVGFSAAALAAAATTAALPGEIKRVTTVSGDAVAADIIHLVVQDETPAVYTVRSFALYLDDGTLFGAYGQADPIIEKSAQAVLLLAVDVTLADIAAAQITFGNADFLLPPATVDRQGLIELATEAEAMAGTDRTRAVTPYTLRVTYGDVWRVSNDGAGSGLDADLLDGQQGSWYLASSAYTAADVRAKLLTVDGAGSGLDADLLDGRQATEFALLAGAAFTGNVSAASLSALILYATASGTGRAVAIGDDAWLGDVNVANTVCVSGSSDGGSGYLCFGSSRSLLGSTNGGVIAIGGSMIWHAGNDGAGSGLDADLLDGRQATEFALLAGAAFTGNVSAASLSAPILFATASGTGRAVAIGNDGWLGDVDVANTVCVSGNSDGGSGYLCFGSSRSLLGSTNGGAIAIGGSVVWHAGNDGAGSGLDADLLDGRQATEFALLAGAAFTGNVSAASLSAPILYATASGSGRAVAIGDDAWLGDVNVANTACVSGSSDGGSGYLCFGSSRSLLGSTNGGVIAIGGSMIWHAGNDGAGSGLDADLLDGQDGEWYRRWANLTGVPGAFPPAGHSHGAADLAGAFAGSLAENGYTVLPNGLILQWMTGPMQAAKTSAATYMPWPIAFPTACFQAFASTQMQQAGDRGDSWFQLVGAPDQNGATIQRQASGTTDDIIASAPRVFAIGH